MKPIGALPANGSDRSALPPNEPVITTNSGESALLLSCTTTAKVPPTVPLPSARLRLSPPEALTTQPLAPAATTRTSHGQSGVPSLDRKSTRLNSSHSQISYAVFCLKKK